MGPEPFNEVGVVSGFDNEACAATGRTSFTFAVDGRVYECWCARPLRRTPRNSQLANVIGYQLGNGEVHISTLLHV